VRSFEEYWKLATESLRLSRVVADPQSKAMLVQMAATWIKLADVGIHGNSHVMMLEKNNRQIGAVIARWLDKTVAPAKKNNRVSAR